MKQHWQNIQQQFSIRINSYEKAAHWMLHPDLRKLHTKIIGKPTEEANRILDLCCGTGIVGRDITPLGWQVEGIDVTREMVDVAKDHHPAIVGEVEKMPYPDNSFDVVTIRQAFMLLEGHQSMKEINRVLKPGGRFILVQSIPFGELDANEYEQIQLARHIYMTRYYDTKALHEIMNDHGFNISKTEFVSVRESVDHWLNNALALPMSTKEEIKNLIQGASDGYKKTRNVKSMEGELFENWNWAVIEGIKV